ncbi:hypothetical protein SETIT_6G010300v2 [Setaria italica]|uniref:Uncharacterized protein n=1 Tax=Setaria italica TaxID=4555 RepID=K3YP41_SETIT|nr:hypothetical protein SETIT_6G010300v2 [Setaria italica]
MCYLFQLYSYLSHCQISMSVSSAYKRDLTKESFVSSSITTTSTLCSRDRSNFVNCIRYSPDGSKFITVSSDKKGLIYDGKTGEEIGELSTEGSHTGSIYAVSWSPDSKQVLTVSADKTVKVRDIMEDASGKLNRTLACPGTGGVDDMLVGCLWQNDHLVTVSLGGT